MAQNCVLLSLPTDALLALSSYLGPQDLLQFGTCCRLLREIACSDCLWMSLCRPWEKVVDLQAWRAGVESAPALFRLLLAFHRLVGSWTAKGQEPRGSLLYITWGSLSLVACKVFASMTGELKLRRLFEVVGLQNGSFKVELFSKDLKNIGLACVGLPGKLVWASKNESEFSLEANELYEGIAQRVTQDGVLEPDDNSFFMQLLHPHEGERIQGGGDQRQPPGLMFPDLMMMAEHDGIRDRVTMERRADQHLLDRRFVLEEHQQRPQESGGISFSQRALQYLIRLASPTRSSSVFEGHSNEESSMEQGHILRCPYTRLTVAEATPEKEFVGLWSGIYGPHGVEIINVSHTYEGISGTKVVGDPNVPSGQVSFRVNPSSDTLEVPVKFQQIVDLQLRSGFQPFNIVKLYEGYGRIAGHNFRNPLWVPGHLLVSRKGTIAFLWEDVNFVVPFEKLNLADFYQSQEQLGKVL